MKVILKEYGPGAFMRIMREWTGLTQIEFGKRIGKCARTIQDYELEKTNYSSRTLQKIAEEFKISIVAEKEKNDLK